MARMALAGRVPRVHARRLLAGPPPHGHRGLQAAPGHDPAARPDAHAGVSGRALPPREAIWPRAGLRDEPPVAGVGWRGAHAEPGLHAAELRLLVGARGTARAKRDPGLGSLEQGHGREHPAVGGGRACPGAGRRGCGLRASRRPDARAAHLPSGALPHPGEGGREARQPAAGGLALQADVGGAHQVSALLQVQRVPPREVLPEPGPHGGRLRPPGRRALARGRLAALAPRLRGASGPDERVLALRRRAHGGAKRVEEIAVRPRARAVGGLRLPGLQRLRGAGGAAARGLPQVARRGLRGSRRGAPEE
mmetsp:Transcript_33606/g.99777  ORF Transcript_33606/g.99777 Transcript_33606/m.99777 type:complete len:308 (-) Transcript_33606:382-1305(-)